MEQPIHDHPNALSSKWPRMVTNPQVEQALLLWVKHMEKKGEVVNGPMLIAKRTKFEESLDVAENERLKGNGWIGSFY